ncbi:hypothetical protein SAMN06297251_10120 [Fulvimarina manganoxydans]|uniref:Uncharacterized protein n=1 Tax=Fulvimarina manganoxydans TaxID=937218 RepID=A0A1W1Y869_9HYPH|nr:hypothetical protein [Fulvimarina manganoxydans]SMC32349.1 hypothetical protein SAMN06297251_10120 [Fulvimarina manganoxydans]
MRAKAKHISPVSYLVAAGALIAGIVVAQTPAQVYADPAGYTVSRLVDESGHDRVVVDVDVLKLLSCDLESGRGPVWVDFSDPDDVGVPPPSPFFRPDGTQAGKTMGAAGDTIPIRGYYALVPSKLADGDGSWTVRVPCQLWTLDDAGNRVWGRKVVASFGPLPLPPPGAVATDRGLGIPLGDLR